MNLRDELERDTGDYPPSWTPKEGDVICGPILRYSKVTTRFQTEALVCVIDDDQAGALAVWLTSCVLLDQFKRLRPKVGEVIGLKYLGKHPEKEYHRYLTRVDRPEEAEPDFDAVRPLDQHAADVQGDPFEGWTEEAA